MKRKLSYTRLGKEKKMKLLRLALVLMLIVFAIGCASQQQVKESEFWQHSSMFKTWDHLKFSVSGYENPIPGVAEKSKDQGWWGIPVDVPATK